MDKILIIGYKGALGQQLMRAFKESNPIGWDIEDLDITQESQVLDKILALKPTLVINASAYNAVDKCEESEKEFEIAKKVNGLGPGYLARVCAKLKAPLVHYSTDYVFSGENKAGYLETDKPNPIQNYGQSKLLGEKEIIKHTNDYYIIRTSKLFGKPGISDASKKSFVDIMLDLAWEKEELSVVNEEVSCFTYTPDLAKNTRFLIENKYAPGIYHVVNENPCTWYECAIKLFEIIGKNVKVKPIGAIDYPRPAKRPAFSVLINNKLPRLRTWEDAVKEYLKISI